MTAGATNPLPHLASPLMHRTLRFKLRCLLGEFLIETGEMIRDIGGFVLPHYDRHPAFASNADLDKAPGPILDSGRGK